MDGCVRFLEQPELLIGRILLDTVHAVSKNDHLLVDELEQNAQAGDDFGLIVRLLDFF